MLIRPRGLLSSSGSLRSNDVLGCSITGLVLGEVGMLIKMGWVVSVKLEKKFNFLKKGKTVISIENRKFSRSWMTKRIAL